MSTTLTTYKASDFLALNSGESDLAAAIASVGEVETFGPGDLTRVKVPTGGATSWTIEGVVTENVKAIEGIICHVQKSGVLWPTLEPTQGCKPVLRSFDLKTAEQAGPIPAEMAEILEKYRITDPHAEGPQLFNWENLPYNQFGSGKNGVGKRVSESRLVSILRPGDIYPLIVRVPAGSLGVFRKFFLQLPNYTKKPYWHSVVSLSLEKASSTAGQPYAKIKPELKGMISDEEAKVVFEKYTSILANVAVQVAEEEEEDEIFGDE